MGTRASGLADGVFFVFLFVVRGQRDGKGRTATDGAVGSGEWQTQGVAHRETPSVSFSDAGVVALGDGFDDAGVGARGLGARILV